MNLKDYMTDSVAKIQNIFGPGMETALFYLAFSILLFVYCAQVHYSFVRQAHAVTECIKHSCLYELINKFADSSTLDEVLA